MPHVDNKVLVYHYRANGTPVVKNGIAAILESELHRILTTHPKLRKTVKVLPHRGARRVDIHQRDLLHSSSNAADISEEAEDSSGEGNHGTEESNVAGLKLPFRIWLEGLATGGYESVVVLSEGFGGCEGVAEVEGKKKAGGVGVDGKGKGNGGKVGDQDDMKGKGKEAKADENVKEKGKVRGKTKLGSLDVGDGGWKA